MCKHTHIDLIEKDRETNIPDSYALCEDCGEVFEPADFEPDWDTTNKEIDLCI